MEEIPLGPADQPASALSQASQQKRDVSFHKSQSGVMEHLAGSIEKLPVNERMVICLRYHDELNFKEIALVLDLAESKVDQLYRRAMTRLGIASREGFA